VRWLAFLSVAGLLGLFVAVPRAQGVEYRLLVANIWDSGFNAFAKLGVLANGHPLEFLWFHEERRHLWERHLSKSVDLSNSIAVVAGANSHSLFPDVARLLVNQADQPMTYKPVLIWRQAPADFEAPRIPRTR